MLRLSPHGFCAAFGVATMAQEAIDRLNGIRCGSKPTSCPDQLAKTIAAARTTPQRFQV